MRNNFLILFVIINIILFTSHSIAQKKTKPTGVVTSGEEMEIIGLGFEKKAVPNASIEIRLVTPLLHPVGSVQEPRKSQANILLKTKTTTDAHGVFTVSLNNQYLDQLPDDLMFTFTIKPPQSFDGIYDNNTVTITIQKPSDGKIELVLLFEVPTGTKSNKGTFAVSAKAQK